VILHILLIFAIPKYLTFPFVISHLCNSNMESLLICYMRTGAVMLRHNHHGDGVRWAVRRHMLPAPRRRRPTDLSRREDKLAQFFGDATCLSALKVGKFSFSSFKNWQVGKFMNGQSVFSQRSK
jgi:hypothetical protein